MRNTIFVLLFTAVNVLFSCQSEPKVIEAQPAAGAAGDKPIFSEPGAAAAPAGGAAVTDVTQDMHNVVVKEVLNTDKYSYLRVTENGQEFWVAISRRDVEIGGHYVYTGGLMKKDFQSREFNRVFETVYLVSDFRDAHGHTHESEQAMPSSTASLEPPKNLKPAPGAIKIADLVANLKKYEGKSVKVTGKCVKVNPMIMGRNWIHLQDGSGKNLDLTVTTTEMVQPGAILTLEGTLALNKDFGAGYRYDYLLEFAVVVK
jgi:hypothetical protein